MSVRHCVNVLPFHRQRLNLICDTRCPALSCPTGSVGGCRRGAFVATSAPGDHPLLHVHRAPADPEAVRRVSPVRLSAWQALHEAGVLRTSIAEKDRAAAALRRQLEAAKDARDATACDAAAARREAERATGALAAAEATVGWGRVTGAVCADPRSNLNFSTPCPRTRAGQAIIPADVMSGRSALVVAAPSVIDKRQLAGLSRSPQVQQRRT